MPSVKARLVGKGRKHKDRDFDAPVFRPPPISLPPPGKTEALDGRIRNLEALDPGFTTGAVLASYMAIPGLVGFWPMSSVQRSTGNVYDLSGQSRTLTYNGNPSFTYFNGLVPYIDLDGTGDYLSRADETDLDILGSENIYTVGGSQGLTLGGWFWLDDTSGSPSFLGKHDNATPAGSAYLIYLAGGSVHFIVYNGTSSYEAVNTLDPTTGAWYFIAGRYTTSTEVAVFVGNNKVIFTTSIPASLNNVAAAFQIGARAGGNLINGRAALCFLSANTLSDDLINSLYQTSRILFNV